MIAFVAYSKENNEIFDVVIDQPIGIQYVDDRLVEDNTHTYLLNFVGNQYILIDFEWRQEDNPESIKIKPMILPPPKAPEE